MKLAIVGSQIFDDYEFLKNKILWNFPMHRITEIVSGGAIGADALAKQFANEMGLPIKEFLPDWDTYGKAAGMIRNKDIITYADVVAAFWDGLTKGTKNSIQHAKKQKKYMHIFYFNRDTSLF